MDPARPLREVFDDLVSDPDTRARFAEDPRGFLAMAGHPGLPGDLVARAVADYAEVLPPAVAEQLEPVVASQVPVVLEPAEASAEDPLARLAAVDPSPDDWFDSRVDDAAPVLDLDGPDGLDGLDDLEGPDGLDDLEGLDGPDGLDGLEGLDRLDAPVDLGDLDGLDQLAGGPEDVSLELAGFAAGAVDDGLTDGADTDLEPVLGDRAAPLLADHDGVGLHVAEPDGHDGAEDDIPDA